MSAAAPLIDYLKQLQAKGQTHVSMDDPARQILRKFYVHATQPNSQVTTQQTAKPPTQSVASSAPVPVKTVPAAPVTVTGNTTDERLASLKALCSQHAPLKQLGSLRQQLVFPEASDSADIMFIGEAPGYHEERQSRPFAGPAGEKLDGILKAMGLARNKVHITTILKFRPAIANQTTNNRPASQIELDAARQLIDQEIKLLKPKVIVTLGSAAARFFTQNDSSLDDLRLGKHQYKGIPLRPTYHPSHLLHQEDTEDKRKVWQDMLKVMGTLNMPISERQRGFFKKKS